MPEAVKEPLCEATFSAPFPEFYVPQLRFPEGQAGLSSCWALAGHLVISYGKTAAHFHENSEVQ